MATSQERQIQLSSRPTSPDDFFNGDTGAYDFGTGPGPRIQLMKPSYPTNISDETLFDLGILQCGQQQSGLALNLQYLTPQQYMLPQQGKEDSLELEDYVQGLNDRFELSGDQILPMTPRCSFEQGSSLRTDNTINFSPSSTSNALLPSPATSELTPPRSQIQDIYQYSPGTMATPTTTQLKDIAIPPPFVQKTPMGPVAYNPQMPVYIQQGMYAPPRHQHVQTASMADITSSPVSHQRFPTPPLSNHGELLQSPSFHNRSMSPLNNDLSSSPGRHTTPEESDFSTGTSHYGSPQRRNIASFDTPPFSPVFPHHNFGPHLQPRRGHARGYSTTSIMTNTTFATDASSPLSSSDADDTGPYINDGPVKSRGTRQSNIPDATMAAYIAGPDPSDHKFICLYPECGKRFGRKYNIQSHIQTHLSDRPYRCDICRAGFVRQHDLRRHEKIHGGDKPFVCACRKSFARQDALTRHRQRGICIGAFEESRRQRQAQDSVKGHRRRNSTMN